MISPNDCLKLQWYCYLKPAVTALFALQVVSVTPSLSSMILEVNTLTIWHTENLRISDNAICYTIYLVRPRFDS